VPFICFPPISCPTLSALTGFSGDEEIFAQFLAAAGIFPSFLCPGL
jgi:hypothetical protein